MLFRSAELPAGAQERLKMLARLAVDNPERGAELIVAWHQTLDTGGETGVNFVPPRPPHEYLVAEMKNIIARETLENLVGMSDADLDIFVRIKDQVIAAGADSASFERLLKDGDVAGFQKEHPEFTAEQLEIFVLGTKHIHAQASRAEFMRAVRTIRALEGAEETLKTIVKENEADFVRINPRATPLLARRIAAAQSLEEQLFAMVVLGDDRLIEGVVINGKHP